MVNNKKRDARVSNVHFQSETTTCENSDKLHLRDYFIPRAERGVNERICFFEGDGGMALWSVGVKT